MTMLSAQFLGDPSKRVHSLDYTHPKAIGRFKELEARLVGAHARGELKRLLLPFESYRTPSRQRWLIEHTTATKAGPWKSAHQYGLAVDFVPYRDGKWSWEEEPQTWTALRDHARTCGLDVPYLWDKVHVEHPLFNKLKATGLV
jgi:hypothetical protein